MSWVMPQIQNYPPPTELPPMRVGELDGRFFDCAMYLNALITNSATPKALIGDNFTNVNSITFLIARRDAQPMSTNDLQLAPVGEWPTTLDPAGRVVYAGFLAPAGSAGVAYVITLSGATFQGRLFVRDWLMSVVPILG